MKKPMDIHAPVGITWPKRPQIGRLRISLSRWIFLCAVTVRLARDAYRILGDPRLRSEVMGWPDQKGGLGKGDE